MWSPARWLSASACLAGVMLVAGCGSPEDRAAERQASSLRAAIADGDGAGACALLSSRALGQLEQSAGKPCPQAILEESVPTSGESSTVRVFGNMAEVKYPGETVFLSRYSEGWRVSAAGCTATPSGIYDCTITGG